MLSDSLSMQTLLQCFNHMSTSTAAITTMVASHTTSASMVLRRLSIRIQLLVLGRLATPVHTGCLRIICGQYRATLLQIVRLTIHYNVAVWTQILGYMVMAKAHTVLLHKVLVVPPHLHHVVISPTLANAVENFLRTSHVKPATVLDTVLSTVTCWP
jgi:hypothetical protein